MHGMDTDGGIVSAAVPCPVCWGLNWTAVTTLGRMMQLLFIEIKSGTHIMQHSMSLQLNDRCGAGHLVQISSVTGFVCLHDDHKLPKYPLVKHWYCLVYPPPLPILWCPDSLTGGATVGWRYVDHGGNCVTVMQSCITLWRGSFISMVCARSCMYEICVRTGETWEPEIPSLPAKGTSRNWYRLGKLSKSSWLSRNDWPFWG